MHSPHPQTDFLALYNGQSTPSIYPFPILFALEIVLLRQVRCFLFTPTSSSSPLPVTPEEVT
ncbi:hypothetical protein E2562_012892 [Oryza meyeriana var. granulata]|uniref:Uncharacterized protein n=1 Tax=Oryza meyeriana var. granulata TaxID=110450 RepID=A0A6G1CEX6_9ORYZ|nr:hypothetical protein E2562_012892 [Oryza meyeriana var. granulata]